MRILSKADSVLSACSAEFYDSRWLAIGTYQIAAEQHMSQPTQRFGRCLLYDTADNELKQLQQIETPAILDMKWLHNTLALANARGQVMLSSFVDTELQPGATLQIADESILALSLCWNRNGNQLITSLSDGSCVISNLANLQTISFWNAHSFEAWIAAFDVHSDDVCWTGGDDCLLKSWDTRASFSSPTSVNKQFDGGVTAIQSHPRKEHVYAVGSYDSHLRLFDKRNPQREVSKLDAGGGIWRIKWHPAYEERLALATMHDGFKVWTLTENGLQSTVENRAHSSLAYGIDWNAKGDIVASCSFYDHTVSLWQP